LQLESQQAVAKGLKTNPGVANYWQLEKPADGRNTARPALLAELARSGVRITEQRRVLVEIIQDSSEYLDATGLLELARKQEPGIDRATVYRTIGLLKTRGLIDELDLRQVETEKRFYGARSNRDNCQMACVRCGAVADYAGPGFAKLKTEMAKQGSFLIRALRVQATGFCPDCKRSA
jgi:Fur family transcriptional regulator, ferric uptake regulator